MTPRKENHECSSIHSPNNLHKFLCQQINFVSHTSDTQPLAAVSLQQF